MTPEQLAEIALRAKAAHAELVRVCGSGGSRAWQMSIPVRPDDSDIVIGAALADVSLLVAHWREALKDDRWLREFAWLNHGCSGAALYGDDGEMQCAACYLDFARMTVYDLLSAISVKRQRQASVARLNPDSATTDA